MSQGVAGLCEPSSEVNTCNSEKKPDGDVDDNYANEDNACHCRRPVELSSGRMTFSDICYIFS
jgi:hypothetical protein